MIFKNLPTFVVDMGISTFGVAELNSLVCIILSLFFLLFFRRYSKIQITIFLACLTQSLLYFFLDYYRGAFPWTSSVSLLTSLSWTYFEASYFALINVMICEIHQMAINHKITELTEKTDPRSTGKFLTTTGFLRLENEIPRKWERKYLNFCKAVMIFNFVGCFIIAFIIYW